MRKDSIWQEYKPFINADVSLTHPQNTGIQNWQILYGLKIHQGKEVFIASLSVIKQ